MGFSSAQAEFALAKTNNNPDLAIGYLFDHSDIDQIMQEEKSKSAESEELGPYYKATEDLKQPFYSLKASVVHLGANYQSGHYVCYIKKNDKWIYYNDAKVAESSDPALGKGSLYLFKRCN